MKITSTILGILLLGTSTLMAQGYKSQGAGPRENPGQTAPRLDQGRSYTPSQYNQQQQRHAQQYGKPDKATAFDGPVSIITPRGRTVRGEIDHGVFQMSPNAIAMLKQDYYEGPNGGTVVLNLPLDMQIIIPTSNPHTVNICLVCPPICRFCDIFPCIPLSDYLQTIQGTQAKIAISDGRQVSAVFDRKGQLQTDYQTKQTLKRALQEGRSFSFYFQDGVIITMGPNAISTATGCCYPSSLGCCFIWLSFLFL